MDLFTTAQLATAAAIDLEIIFDDSGGCIVQTRCVCRHFEETRAGGGLCFWEIINGETDGRDDWSDEPHHRRNLADPLEIGEVRFAAEGLNNLAHVMGDVLNFIEELRK